MGWGQLRWPSCSHLPCWKVLAWSVGGQWEKRRQGYPRQVKAFGRLPHKPSGAPFLSSVGKGTSLPPVLVTRLGPLITLDSRTGWKGQTLGLEGTGQPTSCYKLGRPPLPPSHQAQGGMKGPLSGSLYAELGFRASRRLPWVAHVSRPLLGSQAGWEKLGTRQGGSICSTTSVGAEAPRPTYIFLA